MKLNIHPIIRFLIGGAIFVLYILALVQWQWFDPIIKWSKFAVYPLVFILGALCAAVLYGLLPTKKVIRTTAVAINGGGKKDRVIGYWQWLFCGAVLFVIWLPIYINEM